MPPSADTGGPPHPAEKSAELERWRLGLTRRSVEIEAQIAVLREQLATETAELDGLVAEQSRGEDPRAAVRAILARRRCAGQRDADPSQA